ncbi:PREDICTED: uncharacterized protein LOC109225115 [Nicotiana attenuata]|uniref:DUF538 domain-containing protein n=1 Tax=Nicotiana attenuata TaxID=49451 RepID=A0A1J6IG43_NICAT|nr:PREDICTED: uncharacterized protein LOC109225115 [Nicotiana attenuata]OIT04037.1 hypothetical protein A4A49_64298 [Nicotiana attenuata]
MASDLQKSHENEREGAEITYGAEDCYRKITELLQNLGFPNGVLPLKELEEFGYVRKTGFAWMKQKAPYEHYFSSMKLLVSYATEVTAYVELEKRKLKKINGVKGKKLLIWVPTVEMSIEDPASKQIYFKIPIGIGKSFPITAFMTEEEKHKYLEKSNE